MNIAKHMEAVFIAALAALGAASYLGEARQVRPAIQDSSIATETRMAVVVVKGKREQPVLLAARDSGTGRM